MKTNVLLLSLVLSLLTCNFTLAQESAKDQRNSFKNKYRQQFRKKASIAIMGGANIPSGNLKTFADNSLGAQLAFHKFINPKFSLGLGLNYDIFSKAKEAESSEKMKNLMVSVGPEYSVYLGKFSTQLYTHLSTSFVKTPNSYILYPKTATRGEDVVTDKITASSNAIFGGKIGFNFGYEMTNKLGLNINVEYATLFNNAILYQHRDLSEIVRDGQLNLQAVDEIPFEDVTIDFSNVMVKVGITYVFGKTDGVSQPVSAASKSAKVDGVSQPVSAASKSAKADGISQPVSAASKSTKADGISQPVSAASKSTKADGVSQPVSAASKSAKVDGVSQPVSAASKSAKADGVSQPVSAASKSAKVDGVSQPVSAASKSAKADGISQPVSAASKSTKVDGVSQPVSAASKSAKADGVSQPVSAASKSAKADGVSQPVSAASKSAKVDGVSQPVSAASKSAKADGVSQPVSAASKSAEVDDNSETNTNTSGTDSDATEQNGTPPLPSQAQDWNSSRSNKTSKTY